jgi:DNA repair protein RecO (recombination protein O)
MSTVHKSLYRDEGIVLRTQKLGEADRIVTVLTRRHGKVRAVAKGVRRTKSKFGARLETFSHVDLQLWTGRSLDIVNQAESIRSYGTTIAADYPAYTAGTAVLETADRLTAEEKEPSLRLFLLVVGALRSLADNAHPAGLVLDAFLLRAMSVAGWEPALSDCARCGEAGPHRHFSVPAGGSVCPGCRPTGSAMPNAVTIELLEALLSGNWNVADASAPAQRREGSGLVAALLQWHLERGLRSLPLVDRSDVAPQRVPVAAEDDEPVVAGTAP